MHPVYQKADSCSHPLPVASYNNKAGLIGATKEDVAKVNQWLNCPSRLLSSFPELSAHSYISQGRTPPFSSASVAGSAL